MSDFTLEEGLQTLPEDTVLEANVQAVEDRETPWNIDDNDPSKGKRREVSFVFQVTEPGDHQGRIFYGNTPTYFDSSPNCRLRVWVEEILGADELPVGFRFNTADLIDMPVKIALGVGKKKGKNFVADVIRNRASVGANAGGGLRPGISTPGTEVEPF
jgi:hypothetical protein